MKNLNEIKDKIISFLSGHDINVLDFFEGNENERAFLEAETNKYYNWDYFLEKVNNTSNICQIEFKEYFPNEICSACGGKSCHIYTSGSLEQIDPLNSNHRNKTRIYHDDWNSFRKFCLTLFKHSVITKIAPLFNPLEIHKNGNEHMITELIERNINPYACQFLGEEGCLLPRNERPQQCNKFACEKLKKSSTKRILVFKFNVGNADDQQKGLFQGDLNKFYEILIKKHFTVFPVDRKTTVLLKPSSRCNLDCKYCYDADSRDICPDMTLETLEKAIRLIANSLKDVEIIWHGGEATMVGVDFYYKAQEIIAKYPMLEPRQSMMSNGIYYNNEWLEMFRKTGIRPGMSYDVFIQNETRGAGGPHENCYSEEEQHDIPQEDRIPGKVNLEATLKLYNKPGLQYYDGSEFSCGVINVMSSHNYKRHIETYEKYKEMGVGVVMNNIFPTIQSVGSGVVLEPEDIGDELIKYFKYWFYDKEGIYERRAVEILNQVIGSNETTCHYQDCRYRWIGILASGEIHPCDRYAPPRYQLGHINDFETIEDVYKSQGYQNYVDDIQERFDSYCKKCGYLDMCGGGCNGTIFDRNNGDASKVDSFTCRLNKYLIREAYDFLRNIDLIEETEKINPHAYALIAKYNFYSIKEIKGYMKEAGVFLPLAYDKSNLLNCSEYKIFRGINYFNQNSSSQKHTDFVLDSDMSKKEMKLNKYKRKKDFFNYLKTISQEAFSGRSCNTQDNTKAKGCC